MRVRYSTAPLACIALLVAGCGAESASDSGDGDTGPASIAIGVSPNLNVAGMQIGIDEGIFAENDLEVELDTHQSSSASIPLLLNDQWQMTTAGAATVVTAVAEGIDVQIFGAVSYNVATDDGAARSTLVRADSDMTAFEDLSGDLGVNAIGSSFDVHTRTAVDKSGGDSSQLTSVEVPLPNSAAALRDGRIDAVTLPQPLAHGAAQDADLRGLGDPAIISLGADDAPIIYLMAAGDYLRDNADAVERFLDALSQASEQANENPDAIHEAASTLMELPPDVFDGVPLPGYGVELDREVLQAEIDVLVEHADLTAETAPSADDMIWAP